MFLLVPAHPGCPGQNPKSHKTVVCVCVCMHVGPRYLARCVNIKTINGNVLDWVKKLRYFGVYLVSSSKFKCNYAYAKKAFYHLFNAIFGRVGRQANEEVVLNLIKVKCLPVLLYGVDVCPVNV